MSINDNISKSLDKQFENNNFLPQKLELEDISMALKDYLSNLKLSVMIENGTIKEVPLLYLTQEMWSERKMYWKNMRSEQGQEVTRPYMTLYRSGVKKGTAPNKFTIPNKKKFTFIKVPKFDGTLKGYDIYKVPQPVYVDIQYELRFITHYMQHVDDFYEKLIRDAYSDRQAYLNVNGYYIPSKIEDPSEENVVDDINSERIYNIIVPITVHGKLIDPTNFEKVNTITKISIKITEKIR